MPCDAATGEEDGVGRDSAACWRATLGAFTVGCHHHQLGVALQAAGQRAAALTAFERAVAADPGRYASALRLVRLLDEGGDRERAHAVLENALARDPDALALALAEEDRKSVV